MESYRTSPSAADLSAALLSDADSAISWEGSSASASGDTVSVGALETLSGSAVSSLSDATSSSLTDAGWEEDAAGELLSYPCCPKVQPLTLTATIKQAKNTDSFLINRSPS